MAFGARALVGVTDKSVFLASQNRFGAACTSNLVPGALATRGDLFLNRALVLPQDFLGALGAFGALRALDALSDLGSTFIAARALATHQQPGASPGAGC